jgi:hypothetical protein
MTRTKRVLGALACAALIATPAATQVAAQPSAHAAKRHHRPFCKRHRCIPYFNQGRGYIVQCQDRMWSHSGGRPGVCSGHGGLRKVTASSARLPAAARVRECGNKGVHRNGRYGWGNGPISGAGTYNLTTRHVSCRRARRFVNRYRGTDTYYPTWDCRERNAYESSDVRCTASRGRVIRWQSGA